MSIPELSQQTNNLDISSATYLGGSGQDSANAVDISLNGNVTILGGELPQYKTSGKQIDLLGGGDGAIVRYDNATKEVFSVTNLPGEVKDLKVNPSNGQIAIAGEFGVAVLSPDASQVIWSDTSRGAERVDISAGGKVAAVKGATKVALYDTQGNVTEEISTGHYSRRVNDVAITDENVYLTGFDQKIANLQVAYTEKWSLDGKKEETQYDFSASEIKQANLMADTRGERIEVGEDGKLHVAYSINGGTGYSIFSRDPFDFSKSASSKTVQTDKYNHAYNTGTVKMTWVTRTDLDTLALEQGESILTRRSNGQGNSITVNGITADKQGNVYLTGEAFASIENRDKQTIENQPVAGYGGGEGYFLVLSPEGERLVWTPIATGEGNAVSVRGDVAALAVSADDNAKVVTLDAVQDQPGGGQDGYLLVIGGEDGGSNPNPTPQPQPQPTPDPQPQPTPDPQPQPTPDPQPQPTPDPQPQPTPDPQPGSDDTLSGANGQVKFTVKSGESIEISNFGGVGRGADPTKERINEIDTLQFDGANHTADNLQLTQQGTDLVVGFEGTDTQVVLTDFALDQLENLSAQHVPSGEPFGNIIFGNQKSTSDSFDVFNADSQSGGIWNRDSVTFLNDLNNEVTGFDSSDDVINGQGGNDVIRGLGGNDTLRGNGGDDELIGSTGQALTSPEVDKFAGGAGADLFKLADSSKLYYSYQGNADYAQINDFNSTEGDMIQLSGKAEDYGLGTVSEVQGTGIFKGEELVAVVKGTDNLNLNSESFKYV